MPDEHRFRLELDLEHLPDRARNVLRQGDHVLVTDSTYVPRIQEAQATIYHALVRGLEAGS